MSDYEEKLPELPPNRPPGILGEPGLDVMKVHTFEPEWLNAGLVAVAFQIWR